MKEMKIYSVEYKNKNGFTCGYDEVKGRNEDHAVKLVQLDLLSEGDYMTELRSVDENIIHDEPVWSIKNGPELDQEDQDTLNDAFINCVNEDGVTLKQVFDKEIENNK